MKKLNEETVLLLHSISIKKTGGLSGIRDKTLLILAINAPFQTYANVELYSTVQEKAARLCYGIIKNHAFIDGNKRTGILSMLVFLELNNIVINCQDDDLIHLGFQVADGSYNETDVLSWINKYS